MAAEQSVIWRDQMAFINNTMYIGRVSQASCEIRRKTTTLGGLGGIGSVDVPTGKFEPIKARINFTSLSVADIRQLTANDGYIELRMTGTVRVLDTNTGTRTVGGAVSRIKGWVLNPPTPTFAEEPQPYDAEISVLFVEVSDQQGVALLIDIPNGIVEPSGSSGSSGITITV
ncbi:hypothetical protein D3C85_460520 [compost metagenome]